MHDKAPWHQLLHEERERFGGAQLIDLNGRFEILGEGKDLGEFGVAVLGVLVLVSQFSGGVLLGIIGGFLLEADEGEGEGSGGGDGSDEALPREVEEA